MAFSRAGSTAIAAAFKRQAWGTRWSIVLLAAQDCACRWSASAATTSDAASTMPHRNLWYTRRSISASPCSTPPMSIAARSAARRSSLAGALGPRRKDIVLATKVGMPMDDGQRGASRRIIIAGVEASLRRLNTDWIDLYQQHQPDPLTPIEETLRAFDDLDPPGQGALHRLLQPEGVAGCRGALDVAYAGSGAVRVLPGRIQPADAPRR